MVASWGGWSSQNGERWTIVRTAYSRHNESGMRPHFNFRKGNTALQNPDTTVLQNIWSLAAVDERVGGDEGEGRDATSKQLPLTHDRM